MTIRLASDISLDSIVDGEGIRAVIWTQGCPHHCKGCHNPETHDYKGGFEIDTKEVIDFLKTLKGHSGITFSGGDPIIQSKACKEIACAAHKLNLDVWCYTGFLFEDMLKNESHLDFLKDVDVLIDGLYEEDKRSFDLYYKGSSNQRIIDVPASLKQNSVVLIEKYQNKKTIEKYTKKDSIFI